MRRIGKLALAMMAWVMVYQPSFGQYGYPGYGYNGYPGYPQAMPQMAYPQYPYQAPQGYTWYGQPQMQMPMQMPMQPGYRPQPVYTMQPVATPYGYQVYRPVVQQATAPTYVNAPAYPAAVPLSVPASQPVSQAAAPAADTTLPVQQSVPAQRPEPFAAQVAQPMPAAPPVTPVSQQLKPATPEPEAVPVMPAPAAAPVPMPAPMVAPPEAFHEEAPLGSCAGDVKCHQPKDPRHIGDHETGIFGDFVDLRVRNSDLVYGQPRNGIGVLGVPAGGQGILSPDYSAGFRVGGDFALSRSGSIEGSFLWWQNQAHDSVTAPPNTVIQSAVTLPQTLNAAGDSLAADGNYSFDLKVADLVYKHTLCTDHCHYAVNWLAGVRYAHLAENFHGDFSILGATTVDTNITFDGAGPKVGLEGELVGKWGLMVFGRGNFSALAGHFGSNYLQQNVFAGVQGNTDYRNDRIVPILELELGVGWVSPGGHIRLSGGYFVSAWFNAITTPDLVQSVQNNNFTTNSSNLSDLLTFDGFMARVEFRY